MVTKTEKGATYWLAGHQVYARKHVVPVVAKDVYEDDGAIDGIIELVNVPAECRSMLDPISDTFNTVIYKEDLFATRREAIVALAYELLQEEILLNVAKDSLRNQILTLHPYSHPPTQERKVMKLAYVSGKYTDARGPIFEEFNICHAAEVAVKLWSLGIAVICPHTNTKHFDGAASYEDFLEGDLIMVDKCDLMVMVDNWHTSKGAKDERQRALNKNIPVFEWPGNIRQILEFCWPNGVPEKYVRSSENLLSEELHAIVRDYAWRTEQATGGVH